MFRKRRKRFLALFLSMTMIGELLFGSVSAVAAEDSNDVVLAEEVLSQAIYTESFESFAGEETLIGETSSVSGSTNWNGAANGNWGIYVNSGSVLIQPSVDNGSVGNAHDGMVSIKLTSAEAETVNRAQIMYRLPDETYQSLEDGAEYKITAWFKGENGASFPASITTQVNNGEKTDGTSANVTLVDGEWIKGEHNFTVNKGTNGYVTILFGIGWHGSNISGAMYIDEISLTKITVDATAISIDATANVNVGESITVNAALTPANATTPISWSSNDETIATVDESGNITGIASGTATITATAGTVSDTCVVSVTALSEDSDTVFEESFETFANESTTIGEVSSVSGNTNWNGAANGNWSIFVNSGSILVQPFVDTESAGNTHDGNVSIKLASLETSSANRGQIMYRLPDSIYQGLEDGAEYKITAWFKGEGDVSLPTIIMSHANDGNETSGLTKDISLSNGKWVKGEHTFTVTKGSGGYVNMFFGIGWPGSSSHSAMYIDDITLNKVSEDTIEATVITIDETATVEVGKNVTLYADLTPSNSNTLISWSSSDEKVATVNENGMITGVGTGTTTITATAGTVSDTCTVTVTAEVGSFGAIYEESFETFANENTQIGNDFSVQGGNTSWNGAANGGWGIYVNSGSVLVQPSMENAYDGKVSIKLTPASTGTNRAQIMYTLPGNIYNDMVDNGKYRVTVWYKSEGANFNAQMEVKADTYHMHPVTLSNGEWTKGEYEFILDKDKDTKTNLPLTFGIAYPGENRGALYIDKVTVERVAWVDEVNLEPTEGYLEVGKTLDLTYTLVPADVETNVTFTSSDPEIASVDENGKVTGVKAGTVTIKATAASNPISGKCTINVLDKYVELNGITLNKDTLNINPGWQEKLSVTLSPADATVSNATWKSDNETVVTVDENGNITALATGTANISVAVGGFTANCRVTVAEDESFKNKTQNIEVTFGGTTEIDVSKVLSGDKYTLINSPDNGQCTLEGDVVKYTAYTWLMDKDDKGFVDAEYQDEIQIAVKTGNTSAIVTLNVTIQSLEELFYDEEKQWINDVDLLFSEEQLTNIKNEIKEQPNGLRAKLLKMMLGQVDQFLDVSPQAYTPPAEGAASSRDEELRDEADNTVSFLMAYLLTKDMSGYEEKNAIYLEKTIQWVKASLSYPYWGTLPDNEQNADLTAGHHLFSVSMVYHWLKDELKNVTCTHSMGTDGTQESIQTEENVPILQAMEDRLWFVCDKMYRDSIAYDVYVMNHCHVRMGGLMAATLALRGDAETGDEKQNLIKWTGLVMYKDGIGMNALMPDGTSQEGLPYWAYAAEYLIKAGTMIRQAYGIDLFELTHVYENSGDYVLYSLLPQNNWTSSRSLLNIGDSPDGHWYGPSHILRFIAGEYGDATAQWLAEEVENAGIDAVPSNIWMSVMLTDTKLEAVAPTEETVETLKWFNDMDYVISRSDWSGNEDLLSIKTGVPCGKNLMEMIQNGEYPGQADAGHAHPDANHITLYANGEYLLRDEGYSDLKCASNHNTLLVDGKGQLGEGQMWMQEQLYIDNNAIPHIKIAESNDTYQYDYIVGDATEAYEKDLGLDLFERNILFLKEEQVMLVVDNISTLKGTDLELRWFPYSESAGQSGNVYIVEGTKNIMNFYPLSDETTTSFENVTVYKQGGSTDEKTFRQTYTGSAWQNAVAFSWNDIGKEAAYVTYKKGENANEHQFGVNGKIYTINVATNEITVTSGELETEEDSLASDSTISTVLFNGVTFEEFDPDVTTYEVDRWWKTYELEVGAYTTGYGATVTVDYDNSTPGTITLTCVSRDGSSTTVYTIDVTNNNNILGIANVETDRPKEGLSLELIYDNIITPTNPEPRIWANTGLPTLVFDLGELVDLDDVIIAFNWSSARDTYFDLAVSEDGESYTSVISDGVVEKTPGTSNPGHSEYVTVVDDANLAVRYVKIKLRGQSSAGKDAEGAVNSIQEITFTGKVTQNSDGTPDTQPDETPDTQPDKTPDTQPDETPDTQPDKTPDTQSQDTSNQESGISSVDTGDSTPVHLLLMILVISGLALVCMLASGVKRKKNNEN